jgi:hypothetical protein
MEIAYIFIPLALTLVIEPLFFLAIGYRGKRFFILCFLINFITNASMSLWMGLSYLTVLEYHWESTLILEIVIVIVEGVVYYLNDRKVIGFVWSLAANALSFFIGLLIYYLIYGRIYL